MCEKNENELAQTLWGNQNIDTEDHREMTRETYFVAHKTHKCVKRNTAAVLFLIGGITVWFCTANHGRYIGSIINSGDSIIGLRAERDVLAKENDVMAKENAYLRSNLEESWVAFNAFRPRRLRSILTLESLVIEKNNIEMMEDMPEESREAISCITDYIRDHGLVDWDRISRRVWEARKEGADISVVLDSPKALSTAE